MPRMSPPLVGYEPLLGESGVALLRLVLDGSSRPMSRSPSCAPPPDELPALPEGPPGGPEAATEVLEASLPARSPC
eukprot:3190205-Pyramimonas_sp.AAC.2